MDKIFKGALITQKYALSRDVYPPGLAKVIMQFQHKHCDVNPATSKHPKMVDVACGGGQSTKILSGNFDEVLAFDISENQIKTATAGNPSNVRYEVASSDAFPCDDASVDLVTCAEAVHFLNWGNFLKETNRVLKPKGCLALFGYWMPTVIPLQVEGTERQRLTSVGSNIVREFKLRGGYTDWVKEAFSSDYRMFYDLLPWASKEHNVNLKSDLTWSLTQFMYYAESLPNYQKTMARLREDARRRNPGVSEAELKALDYGDEMRRDLKAVWELAEKNDDEIFMKTSQHGNFIIEQLLGSGEPGSPGHDNINLSPLEMKEKLIHLQHENKMLKVQQGELGDERVTSLSSDLELANTRINELETEQ